MEDKNRNIKLINGEEDKTMRLDFSPYTVEVKGKVIPMGQNIWEAMLANTWFIDETNLTEDVYNSTMSIVTNILKTFDKSKIDKYKFNESIRGLIHKSNNLTAEDKYLLDMEVNAFITLHLLDS